MGLISHTLLLIYTVSIIEGVAVQDKNRNRSFGSFLSALRMSFYDNSVLFELINSERTNEQVEINIQIGAFLTV